MTNWTTPITWTSSHPTTTQFNEQIRDNTNNLHEQIELLRAALTSECYMLATTSSPFMFTGISGGSLAAGTIIDADHPGVYQFTSTGGNVGGSVGLGAAGQILIAGQEQAEFVFYMDTVSNIYTRMGFLDAISVSAPTDGVWIDINAATVAGKTANNTTTSTTSSTYTASATTWYRATIVINSAASSVTFTLYDAAGSSLWTDTLTTNIPTGAGRFVGFEFQSWKTTAGAGTLAELDYIKLYTPRTLTR